MAIDRHPNKEPRDNVVAINCLQFQLEVVGAITEDDSRFSAVEAIGDVTFSHASPSQDWKILA